MRRLGSRPDVGSSSRSRSGSWRMARASAKRVFIPIEYARTFRSRASPMPEAVGAGGDGASGPNPKSSTAYGRFQSRQARVEGRLGCDHPAPLPDLLSVRARRVDAEHPDRPRFRRQCPGDDAQRGGLASPVAPTRTVTAPLGRPGQIHEPGALTTWLPIARPRPRALARGQASTRPDARAMRATTTFSNTRQHHCRPHVTARRYGGPLIYEKYPVIDGCRVRLPFVSSLVSGWTKRTGSTTAERREE